ncbi:MAG: PAS domain S-box protein [Candidatus Hydrogenedentes bacterium]|nr:PAS domain S-box protein [Candidatus Hydrogenedentota bacterium]
MKPLRGPFHLQRSHVAGLRLARVFSCGRRAAPLSLLLAFFHFIASSQEIALSPEERDWLNAHPEVEIVSYAEAAPFGFVSEGGEYVGVVPDIAARIQDMLGIRITFRGVEYAELLELVRTGQAECTTLNDPLDVPYDAHYTKTQDFLFLPYSLFISKDSSLAREKPAKVTGKTIALCRGWDLSNPSLNVLEGNRFVFGETMLDCLNLVVRGEADGFFDVHSEVTYVLDKHSLTSIQLFQMYREGYSAAFFVRNDSPQLRSAMDKAIAAIPKSDIVGYLKIWNAYLDEPSYQLATAVFTAEERQWIKEHPVVRVGVDPAYPPFEFIASNGAHQGVASDYLNHIESVLGIRFQIEKSASWAETLEKARSRKTDLVSGIVPTPGRREFLRFTKPYTSLPLAIVTREETPFVSGLDALNGKRIAVVEGYAIQEWLSKDHPKVRLVTAKSTDEAMEMLVNGDADACVETILAASYSMAKLGYANLRISGETDYQYALSLAARKDWPVLATLLDKALATIPDSRRNEFLARWAPSLYTRGFDYSILWKVLAVSALLIAFIAYWNRRLSRIVAERTAALQQEYEKHRENDRRFRAIFNQTFQLIGMLSPDGKVLAVNETALAFKRIREHDVLNKPFWETPWWDHSPALQERLREAVKQAAAGGFVRFEATHYNADGELRAADFSLKPVTDELGNVILLVSEGRDITERKLAEQALQQSETQYRTLFEAANDAIFVVEEGRFVECNPRTFWVFGCSKDRIIGQTPSEFSPPMQPDGRDSHEKSEELISQEMQGKPQSFEWLHRRFDGALFHAEVSLTRMEQSGRVQLLAIVRDVTARKEYEETLKKSEEHFRTLFDLVPFACVVNDVQGRFVLVNQAFTLFSGIPAEQALGRTMNEMGLVRTDNRAEETFARLLEEGALYNVEATVRRPDGQVRHSLFSSRALDGTPPQFLTVTVDITERIMSEKRLYESEEKYRAFFTSTSEGIYRYEADPPIDTSLPEERIFELIVERAYLAECNEAFARMHGYDSPEQMTGMRLQSMIPADPRNITHLHQFLQSGFRIGEVETSGIDRFGRTHLFVKSFVGFVENGFLVRTWGIQRDVTEQRRLDEELRERSEMIRALVETSRDWIWTMNLDGIHTYSNPAVESILGYSPSEIEGKAGLEFMHEDDRQDIELALPGWIAQRRGWQGILTRWRHKDGSWRHLESNAVPVVNATGDLVGFRGVDRDITARVEAEEALRLRQQQLIQADKMVSLGTLVAGVAHEINNPNTFITLNASIFREVWSSVSPILDEYRESQGNFAVGQSSYDVLRENIPELIAGMEQGAARIKKIVASLKDFARQDLAGLDQEVDLNEVVNASVTLMHNRLKTVTHHFTVETCPDLPLIKGNFQRVEQVVINLLSNACDALAGPEKAVTVSTSWDRDREEVIVTVEDEGCGIPESLLVRICDPFFTTKRDSGGTGLGLSISHTIVQEHGGTLLFNSAPGKGTRASVVLPALRGMESHS